MSTNLHFVHLGRDFYVSSFPSLVKNCYFAQVYNSQRTRVVHQTGLYISYESAENAAWEWATNSQSEKAKSLGSSNGG